MLMYNHSFDSGRSGRVAQSISDSNFTIVPSGGRHVSVLPFHKVTFSSHPPSAFKITYRSTIIRNKL
jgi:hypothetical protein